MTREEIKNFCNKNDFTTENGYDLTSGTLNLTEVLVLTRRYQRSCEYFLVIPVQNNPYNYHIYMAFADGV